MKVLELKSAATLLSKYYKEWSQKNCPLQYQKKSFLKIWSRFMGYSGANWKVYKYCFMKQKCQVQMALT